MGMNAGAPAKAPNSLLDCRVLTRGREEIGRMVLYLPLVGPAPHPLGGGTPLRRSRSGVPPTSP